MASLNKVLLMGHLGKDPELRYTEAGKAVCNFSVATSGSWKDSDGNRQEKTEWHGIVVWGNQADFVQKYFQKGSAIFVEGRLQTRGWTDDQQVRRYVTEINASNIQFVGKKGEQTSIPSASAAQAPDHDPGPTEANTGEYDDDPIPF